MLRLLNQLFKVSGVYRQNSWCGGIHIWRPWCEYIISYSTNAFRPEVKTGEKIFVFPFRRGVNYSHFANVIGPIRIRWVWAVLWLAATAPGLSPATVWALNNHWGDIHNQQDGNKWHSRDCAMLQAWAYSFTRSFIYLTASLCWPLFSVLEYNKKQGRHTVFSCRTYSPMG